MRQVAYFAEMQQLESSMKPGYIKVLISTGEYYEKHILVRTSLPRCPCEIDACPPPLFVLLQRRSHDFGLWGGAPGTFFVISEGRPDSVGGGGSVGGIFFR